MFKNTTGKLAVESVGKKMMIKICDGAYDLYRISLVGYSDKYAKIMKNIAGKTMEVDTRYLFPSSFNVIYKDPETGEECIVDISGKFVTEIINDARIGKDKCLYCGKMADHKDVKDEICPFCKHCDMIPIIKTPNQ